MLSSSLLNFLKIGSKYLHIDHAIFILATFYSYASEVETLVVLLVPHSLFQRECKYKITYFSTEVTLNLYFTTNFSYFLHSFAIKILFVLAQFNLNQIKAALSYDFVDKNKYIYNSKISEAKFKEILKLF